MLISAFSDHISPEKSILFAYIGLAFPIIIILNIIFFIYWLIVRKWIFVLLFVISFTICWKPVLNYCPFHTKSAIIPKEDVIKILSYNVMGFAYKDHSKKSPNKIIEYIAESGADIVCLQEYMVSNKVNLMNSEDIANALPMYPYIVEIFFSKSDKFKYGIAVLSKYPVTKSGKINYFSQYNGSSVHHINYKGKNILLVNNHLESFKLTAEDRSKYSDMITQVSIDLFDEFRSSIQQKLGSAFIIRAGQADIISAEIQKINNPYIIVCGDFNDTPSSYVHRKIQGSLNDAYADTGMGPGISYNQNFFFFRIDHIFYSSGMDAYNCIVDKKINLSDHYPISCYLKIK
jgi:endonuclease/exonuclease/phosphatase family metal-dependent hydrolase